MEHLKILNSKEKKGILQILEKQYCFTEPLEYVFMINSKNRIYIVNREVAELDYHKVRVSSMGLYLGELYQNSIRLSIEGSQLIGKFASKNVAVITDEQLEAWVKGEDIAYSEQFEGFVIVKNNDDFYAAGKTKAGILLNFVPRARSLKVLNA